MTNRFKPGSRVQQVWEVFEAKGAQAAYDFGLTLNLKANTLKAWCARLFPSDKSPPVRIKTADGETKLPRRQDYKRSTDRMQEVVMDWGQKAFIVEEGPETSILFFPEPTEHQPEQAGYCNTWFLKLDAKGNVDKAWKKLQEEEKERMRKKFKPNGLINRKKS